MTKLSKILIVAMLLVIVGCMVLNLVGKEPIVEPIKTENDNKISYYESLNLLTSEHQISGSLHSVVRDLLFDYDVDFDTDYWQIQCPYCNLNGAVIYQQRKVKYEAFYSYYAYDRGIVGFLYVGTEHPFTEELWRAPMYFNNYWVSGNADRQFYCQCTYPLGSDWTIIDFPKDIL